MNTRRLAALAAVLFVATGCTQPEQARRVLSAQGFTDIQITGYGWFDCSEDDTFATAFVAKSVNGSEVSGTVCAGLWGKGATVRYD